MTKRTPLTDRHEALDARIVDFAGYAMPVSYKGILEEHQAVRNDRGMFDLSHMGEFFLDGPRAGHDVDTLVTNDVSQLEIGAALYTPMCRENGTIIDDLLVYRLAATSFMLVVNASNLEKDADWICGHLSSDTSFKNRSDEIALIAIQGPNAAALLTTVIPGSGELRSFRFQETVWDGSWALVSRTGYTGEDGFEIYLENQAARSLWDRLSAEGVAPIGLGARDTLRFEAKLLLYGNDIDDTTTPLEAGIAWTVKLAKLEFIGKEFLTEQKRRGVKRKLVGFRMAGKGVPRHGQDVLIDGEIFSQVTSGTHSPTFRENLGLAYVPPSHSREGSRIAIRIRNRDVEALVVKTPFYKRC